MGSAMSKLADVARDARVAIRSLSRDRTFTATALLTLIVCLGANTAIFSIVRSVVLKPLPFENPDRIVLFANLYPKAGFTKAYPIIDGMEGDPVTDPDSVFLGQRLKNGWKNSGAPWTYELTPERLLRSEAR